MTKSSSAKMTPCIHLSVAGSFLNEIEKPFSPGFYVNAVLNVFWRPKGFSRCVVTLVEQRVKRFQDKFFVLLGCGFHTILCLRLIGQHFGSFV